MKKLLPLLKKLLVRGHRPWSIALMLLVLLGINNKSQAQVYYMTNDATSGSTSAVDGINRMDYNGANATLLANSFTVSPGLMEIDLPNNRAFVYEAFSSSPPNGLAIKVINLSTGAVTATIPITEATARCYAIKYDAINDYIYYVVADSGPTAASSNDALIKVKPDGSGKTVVISGFCKNPTLLALDVVNNRAYVYNQLFAEKNLLTINLSSGTVSQTAVITAPATGSFLIQDMDYDAETDYIYYLSSNNSGGTNANDAISKIHPNGTGYAAVVGVAQSPTFMALDLGNNRAFVYDNVAPARNISSIDLSSGVATVIKSLSSLPGSSTVTSLWVPNMPVLSTALASSVSSGSATVGGNITRSDAAVTERGVVYSSTNTTPTINGSGVTKAANGSGTGSFSGSIASLNGSTTYYLRSYATSAAGTSYGAVTTFTTLSNDATLSAFTISAGALTPSFSSGTINYTASVANSNSIITVTPTKNNANASIKVNNVAVNSGSASGVINLNIGDNVITTVVTAQDGTTTKTYTLIVNRPKASQTITFASTATKTYGNADYAPGATASSGLGVSYSSDNPAVATIISGQVHIVAVGTANITASQGGDGNYLAASNVVQTLTVNKASQAITFNAIPAKTYGDADFAPGATASSGLPVSYASDNSLVATIVSNQVHIVGQGTANITASQAGDGNRLAASSVSQSLTVNKATVTVTANAQTKTYGDNDPVFTYTPTGVVGSDAATGALARATGTNIGNYAINQGNLSYGNNYNITFVAANLTIAKRPITIRPTGNTKVYGAADPFLNGYFTDAGSLAPTDGTTGPFGRAAGENVGTYVMTLGSKMIVNSSTSEVTTNNYNITFTPANFIITAKPIIVNANAQTKTYGDPDPAFNYSNTSLSFSDSFTGVLTRVAGEGIGTYAISQGTLALSSNYTLTFNGNNLTIGKKTINVTANAQTKTYGDADPAFTYTNDALVSGDAFTGILSRDSGEGAGDHLITQGTLALSSNYVLNYTGANLTIGKRAIDVFANGQDVQYGDPGNAISYSYSGAITSGDVFTGELGREPGNAIGSYATTLNTLSLTNGGSYNITFHPSVYKIVPREIAVSAAAVSKTYGDTDPALTYNITSGSLLTGDVITGTPVRATGEAAGPYAVTEGTLAVNSPNYNLTFLGGSFEINRAPLSITANNKSKTAGQVNPALTYTIAGFKNSDTEASLTTPVTITTDAITSSPAGNYAINVSNASSPNYDFSFVNGTLTVIAASTNSSLANITLDQGTLDPVFSATAYNYIASVGQGITSVNITPTVADPTATVMVNSVVATSGQATNVPVYAGDNPIQIKVTAEDGITTKEYDVNVKRALNTDAKLASLTVSEGSLSPAFSATEHTYAVSVGSAVGSIVIMPTANSMYGFVKINGAPVETGSHPTFSLLPGNNIFTIEVAAQDRTVTETYVVTVNRLANNPNLASIGLSLGLLNPVFNPGTQLYNIVVPSETNVIRVTPTAQDAGTTLTINGTPITSGQTSDQIPLAMGANSIFIVSTAADGITTKLYKINVARGSDDALLYVNISTGLMEPVPGLADYNYAVSVAAGTNSVRITAVGRTGVASVKVNGVSVVPGTPSDPITLSAGITTITVVGTAENGVTTKTYSIKVSRNGSNNALLNLSLSSGALEATTGTGDYNYTTSVAASSIRVTAIAKDATATIKINGVPAISGTPSDPIALSAGVTPITIVSTAQDGVTTKTYVIKASRNGSNNALLNVSVSSGALEPSTGAGDYNYTASSATGSIRVTAVAKDATATIKINGVSVISGTPSDPIALSAGINTITIISTAQDGTIKKYIIKATQNGSNNALLNVSINTGALEATTGTGDYNYNTSVASGTGSVRVTAIAKDATATIKINGVAATSGTPSDPITLTAGITPITIVSTAQDGVTIKKYVINVSRNGSNNALLNVSINSGALEATTGTGDYNYNTSVSVATNSVRVTAIAKDATATIKINGVTITSGTASDPIALSAGVTPITIVSTAEDGVTTKTYVIKVSRNGSNNALLNLSLSAGALETTTGIGDYNYNTSVASGTTSVQVTVVAKDVTATIKINGVSAVSGTPSGPIALLAGVTQITITSTAQDGVTTKTYIINVRRNGSNNALLNVSISSETPLVPSAGAGDFNYSTTVPSATSSVQITAAVRDASTTITLNGAAMVSGTTSDPIALSTGAVTPITIVGAAQDGVTTKTYVIYVTRAPNTLMVDRNDSKLLFANKTANKVAPTTDDGVVVHQGVSPNGDGSNDFLYIEGISAYDGNKLSIMNTNGALVYETKNYGKNGNNLFDGHSNKNGALLKPGTYYYALEYQVEKQSKRKTGYIIIKY